MEKQLHGPLVLRSRGSFDLDQFLNVEKEELITFSTRFPFFVIRDAVIETGNLVPPVSDGVNGHFHFDADTVVVLSNNYENNLRGRTEWVADFSIFQAFAAEHASLLQFVQSGVYGPRITALFTQLLEENLTRERLNALLGGLYGTKPMPTELSEIFQRIDRAVAEALQLCDWSENPYSSLIFNNTLGFHRGVHTGKGKELRRLTI